jgi:hypothetical protein
VYLWLAMARKGEGGGGRRVRERGGSPSLPRSLSAPALSQTHHTPSFTRDQNIDSSILITQQQQQSEKRRGQKRARCLGLGKVDRDLAGLPPPSQLPQIDPPIAK